MSLGKKPSPYVLEVRARVFEGSVRAPGQAFPPASGYRKFPFHLHMLGFKNMPFLLATKMQTPLQGRTHPDSLSARP